jgi:hypothetical protein
MAVSGSRAIVAGVTGHPRPTPPPEANRALPRVARRLRRGIALAVAAALTLIAGTASAAPVEWASASRAAASTAAPTLRDTVLREPARTLLAREATAVWGGAYTTSTGEIVRVFSSDAYAGDTAFNQVRAEAIVQLPHGPELSALTAYFLTFEEMQSICGSQALACYAPRDQTLVALGENAPDGTSAESILAHEYGHHIARNRLNPPWQALDWGTKRWATTMGICPRVRAGEVFPSDPFRYELDPAEGFAEAYRVLTEIKAGRQPEWWGIVDELFFPNAAALAAIEQDVAAPWTQNASLSRSGLVTAAAGARSRTYRIATPLDGIIRVAVRPAATSAVRLTLSAGATVLARGTAPMTTVQTTVCGQRSVSLRVDRVRGAGTFRLAISRP